MRNLNLPTELDEKQFWLDFYLIDSGWSYYETQEKYSGLVDRNIELHIREGYALVFSFASYATILSLNHPYSNEPIQLGWVDDAHPMANVFRLEELLQLSQCLARQYDNIQHPDRVFLLLHEFTRITSEDEFKEVRILLTQAFESMKMFSDNEINQLTDVHTPIWLKNIPGLPPILAETFTRIAANTRWIQHSEFGWILMGDFPNSLRTPLSTLFEAEHDTPDTFPRKEFHQLLEYAADCSKSATGKSNK